MHTPYASDPARARARLYPEEESAFRSCYQRDRDRIIHSSAFRRLKHKTQVFVEHEGDYFRTRLTHSIEVAQVARTIAGALGLNVELTEAVALAHDLGHTPFGHTGEDALDRLMSDYGGFDHNAQAIRIVTSLERHYAEFDGLNLTWDTLEGIAKHNGPVTGALPYALADYNANHDLELHTYASAEAQVAALADDVAYNNHDLHDGLRAKLFTEQEIAELPVVGACYREVDTKYPGLDPYRRRHEALRRVFGVMVTDVIETSHDILQQAAPPDPQAVRDLGRPVIRFSDRMWADLQVIRSFLFKRMYRAPKVVEMRSRVTKVVEDLFAFYMSHPEFLPKRWRQDVADAPDRTALARLVSDYIAGMTDRFALEAHARLLGGDAGMTERKGI
ncbi:deoxyguanosinetriphosphate triphosphohydrolase [Roseovarius atlanticus]|uniref:deoxyguanosinetriphosphate triphosphohydrolase n=1 Tax=Roseovarius atlanticus TaxID=1641875 RepID=UPI001C958406|nr:deoxyguanosinetriphosphate triphosphohydrolase [Roseovarius atlanticus]MBY5988871.1 deoxyguanosinetriphosphate triphosphohydrolase [Roseovarius atlanticus]MBY6124262.1 deoxyguanosinetriphosphate triphosphohydrolase [Roseovarius atlanticus]MBY6148757.1 deoxyguanosinetriphosphate triphosphohydrolase [Roseovarius atlanticus]